MGVLSRKIDLLLQELKSGKMYLNQDGMKDFVRDLESIRRMPNGEVDLKSCTPLVRQLAGTILSAKKMLQQDESPKTNRSLHADITPKKFIAIQREYFQILNSFFEETTATTAELFGKYDSFSDSLRRDAEGIASRTRKSYPDFIAKHQKFYGQHSAVLMQAKQLFSGMNAVMGGSSYFPKSAFDGYRKMALYADTVFIPDPVLPLLEVERKEERFPIAKVLQSTHDILRLLPLVNADLPYPAVIVFPSWEKSLENTDPETQDGIGELTLGFFSHYLETRFEDETEILEFIIGKGKEAFRAAVNRHSLFIPPECKEPMSVDEGVKEYKNHMRLWRTKAYCDQQEKLPDEVLVFLSIIERMGPQFHIRDNAKMFSAQPLLWNPTHYYYFHLCATATADVLENEKVIDKKTVALLAALNKPAVSWLGNVEINDLVRLRAENANEKFRTELSKNLKVLGDTTPEAVNQIAADVARAISSLISQHSDTVEKTWQEYKKKFVLDGAYLATAGICLSPWLSSLLGVVPGVAFAAIARSAIRNFITYQLDKRAFSNSVMGILSAAKQEG